MQIKNTRHRKYLVFSIEYLGWNIFLLFEISNKSLYELGYFIDFFLC